MGDFDRDTRVEALGEGRYRATPHPDWMIWGPNGGYIAAIALRAAGAAARIARPSSFTCHFLSVARFEPVELEVEVLRAGRRAELIRASMRQDGRLVVETLLRTAQEGPGLEHDVAEPPDIPHFEELPSVDELLPEDAFRHPFWSNLEARYPDPSKVGQGPAVRPPEWAEWYRFRPRALFDDPWVDAGRSLLLLDTIAWPAAAGPHPDSGFIAPSLDVTAWFHDFDPKSEWLLIHQRSPIARSGLMGAGGSVYSSSGKLLATGGSHLLCAPAPPPPDDGC
jgi:acyl-CoA thioesterase-2